MKIEILESYFTSRPEIGNIIFGVEEFEIGRWKTTKREIVEVGVKKDECIFKEKITETFYSKGYKFKSPRIVKTDLSNFDESRKNSVWLIEDVKLSKEFKGLHGTIPENYFVRARKLKKIDGSYKRNGETIEFYTCGNEKNTINKKFEVIGNEIKTKFKK